MKTGVPLAVGLLLLAGCSAPTELKADKATNRPAPAWFRTVNFSEADLRVRNAGFIVATEAPGASRPFLPIAPKTTELEVSVGGKPRPFEIDFRSDRTTSLIALPSGDLVTVSDEPRKHMGGAIVTFVNLSEKYAEIIAPDKVEANPAGTVTGNALTFVAGSIRAKIGSVNLEIRAEENSAYTVFVKGSKVIVARNSPAQQAAAAGVTPN